MEGWERICFDGTMLQDVCVRFRHGEMRRRSKGDCAGGEKEPFEGWGVLEMEAPRRERWKEEEEDR